MLLVDAEHDGRLKEVTSLFEKGGDLLGDKFRTVVEYQGPFEVLDVAHAVFDFLPIAVDMALLRATLQGARKPFRMACLGE